MVSVGEKALQGSSWSPATWRVCRARAFRAGPGLLSPVVALDVLLLLVMMEHEGTCRKLIFHVCVWKECVCSLPTIALTSKIVSEAETSSSKESNFNSGGTAALGTSQAWSKFFACCLALPQLYMESVPLLIQGEGFVWGFSGHFPFTFWNNLSVWWKGLSSSPLQMQLSAWGLKMQEEPGRYYIHDQTTPQHVYSAWETTQLMMYEVQGWLRLTWISKCTVDSGVCIAGELHLRIARTDLNTSTACQKSGHSMFMSYPNAQKQLCGLIYQDGLSDSI